MCVVLLQKITAVQRANIVMLFWSYANRTLYVNLSKNTTNLICFNCLEIRGLWHYVYCICNITMASSRHGQLSAVNVVEGHGE